MGKAGNFRVEWDLQFYLIESEKVCIECNVRSGKYAIICIVVRVQPVCDYVCTHSRRVESYLETLECKHCMYLILFAVYICV